MDGWFDSWLVSSTTKNINCAYAWMDYTSKPDVNGAIAVNFGMAPANVAFCASSPEAQAHCDTFFAEDEELDEEERAYLKVFNRIFINAKIVQSCNLTCVMFLEERFILIGPF